MCPQFAATNVEPGGFSEYIRVPALHVKHTMGKLPHDVSYEQGAMVEPVAVFTALKGRLFILEIRS